MHSINETVKLNKKKSTDAIARYARALNSGGAGHCKDFEKGRLHRLTKRRSPVSSFSVE